MLKMLQEFSNCGNCKYFFKSSFEYNGRVVRLEGCKYFINIKTVFSDEEKYRDYLSDCKFWEARSDNKNKNKVEAKEAFDKVIKVLEEITEFDKNGDLTI